MPDDRGGSLGRLAETFLIAAAGGLIFHLLGLPAGLVSGSVIAVAAASLAGRPLGVPVLVTRAILTVVGIALGSVVTPETLEGLAAYPASIAILAVGTLVTTAVTGSYLRFVHGWDPLAAFLGASPGALSQVMAISAEQNVDIRAIAVVQTLRVVLLTAGLPLVLTLVGFGTAPAPAAAPVLASAPLELAVLVAASAAASYALYLVGFPGGWVFGAMLASAALHGSGLIHVQLPAGVANTAMIALGAVTGSRFAGTNLRDIGGFLAAGLGSLAVSVAVAGLFVLLDTALLGVRPADTMIAFAPGAQETMMLLALALKLDPVFVGTHHLARFMVVSLSVPVIVGVLVRWRRPGSDV